MRPHDLVEFVGPQSLVLNWPAYGAQGAIQSVTDRAVFVMWEGSTSAVAWPPEWVRQCDEHLDTPAAGCPSKGIGPTESIR